MERININKDQCAGELGICPVEFEFMTSFMSEKMEHILFNAVEIPKYIDYLTMIRKRIKLCNRFGKYDHFESNPYGYYESNKDCYFRFHYSYQRFDLGLYDENWVTRLYGYQETHFKSYTLFTISGMSALYVTLLTIHLLYPDLNTIGISKYGYYEIHDMLARHFDHLQKLYYEDSSEKTPDIIILDSSSISIPSSELWLKSSVILIDTTCYEPGNVVLNEILQKLQYYSGLVLLVRSHIKLDCFGLEINRLGSIIGLSSKTHSSLAPNIEQFQKTNKEIIANIGCNLNSSDFYLWLLDDDYPKIAKMRTQRIHDYCNEFFRFFDSLKQNNFKIIQTHHNLFLLAQVLNNKPDDPLKPYIFGICKSAQKLGVALFPAASFGLCYTTFDGFRNKIDNEVYFRIAPSPNMSKLQARKIMNFIGNFFKTRNENLDEPEQSIALHF